MSPDSDIDGLSSGDEDRAQASVARRLDSWKEIAAYLNRDVRTVQRWEKDEGLPVQRLLHGKQGSVYAQSAELDAWWESRQLRLEHDAARVPEPAQLWWRRRPFAAAAAAAAATAVVLSSAVFLLSVLNVPAPASERAAQVVRFEVGPPMHSDRSGLVSPPALSPDGRFLVFAAPGAGDVWRLWLRPLDAAAARELPGTERAHFPFWSPDSQSIGFFADGRLLVMPVAGGPPRSVCDAPQGYGGSWNRHGQIVFAPDELGALYVVPASGGAPRPVTSPVDPASDRHATPFFLPDDDHFLYKVGSWRAPAPEYVGVYVASLSGIAAPQRLLPDDTNAAYSPSGHLLFVRRRALLAQSFDPARLELTGEPLTVADPVGLSLMRFGLFSASPNGHLVYRPSSSASQLGWLDRAGRFELVSEEPELIRDLRLSPDGQHAVAVIDAAAQGSDLWRIDLTSRRRIRLTFNGGNWFPVWSPDVRQVLFSNYETGGPQLRVVPATGGDSYALSPRPQQSQVANDWSRDGRYVLYHRGDYDPPDTLGEWGLSLLDRQTGNDRYVVAGASAGALSPDGRWVAYRDEAGAKQIWVQAVSGSPRWQVSVEPGQRPAWRENGLAIAYLLGDSRVAVTSFSPTAGVSVGGEDVLFDHPGLGVVAIASDFSRALVTLDPSGRQPLTVVLNWTAELGRRSFGNGR